MYLEGITVSVGYPDLLAATLANNLAHLDHLVVVTAQGDVRTQNLCAFYGAGGKVTCVVTDAFYENGAHFNKGAGINAGLAKLALTDWVLHFDADIWFPPGLRQALAGRDLDKQAFYGLDRLMCTSYADWARFLLAPVMFSSGGCLVKPGACPQFPLGERVVHYGTAQGYYPCGYFQLWHPRATGLFTYPAGSAGADHSDIEFARGWPAARRVLLPDAVVVHLDSEASAQGANWYGRATLPFVPAELVGEQVPPAPRPAAEQAALLAGSAEEFSTTTLRVV